MGDREGMLNPVMTVVEHVFCVLQCDPAGFEPHPRATSHPVPSLSANHRPALWPDGCSGPSRHCIFGPNREGRTLVGKLWGIRGTADHIGLDWCSNNLHLLINTERKLLSDWRANIYRSSFVTTFTLRTEDVKRLSDLLVVHGVECLLLVEHIIHLSSPD